MSIFLRPILRRIFIISILIALTACSAVSINQVRDPLRAPPTAIESAVVLSVSSNTTDVRSIDEITLRRVTAATPKHPMENTLGNHFVLNQVARGMARDTTLFIGVLPAGEYEFVRFTDTSTKKYVDLHEASQKRLGRFTVTGGRSIDLGRLIITPVNTHVIFGRSTKILSNQILIHRFSSEYAALFSFNSVNAWNDVSDGAVERYAMQRPVGAECPTEQSDGTVFAGSRLGTLLTRNKEGFWRTIRGPSIESVLCVYPISLANASLIAVGEFNTLWRLAPGANEMVAIDTGNLPLGNLLNIAGNANVGWYIAHQQGVKINLYHSTRLDAGDWKIIASEDISFSFWNGANTFWMWRTNNGFAYAASSGKIHLFDYSTLQWYERNAPNNSRLISIGVNPNNTIGILTSPGGGLGGATASVYLSTSEATNEWKSVNAPFTVKVAPVQQSMNGTLLMVGGGVFSKAELQVSKDGGGSWVHQSDHTPGDKLVPLGSGGLLRINSGRSGIFSIAHSADDGATWSNEYSNFDRDIYLTEQAK